MPTVPVLEKSVQQQRGQVTQIDLPNNYGRYIPNEGLSNLAGDFQEIAIKAKQRGDETRIVEAQRQLDDWEAENMFDPERGALSRKGKDAIGLPDKLIGDYDKLGQTINDGMANDDQKLAFQKMWNNRLDNMRKVLYGHERAQMDTYNKENNQALVKSSSNRAVLYYNVPDVVDQAITDARVAARNDGVIDGLSDEALTQKELEAESSVRLGVLSRMADESPQQAIEFYKKNSARFSADDLIRAQTLMSPTERKYKASDVANKALIRSAPKTAKTDIIKYVMYELEGGDKVVIDNDGGTAKYGINHKHNNLTPQQVADLSEEGAIEIKDRDYWSSMKIDELPVNMRLVAYDAAIQHGADDNTRKMIEDANGDPYKLIEIRREYYNKLVKQNPKQNEGSYDGWMNRLAKLESQIARTGQEQPPLEEVNAYIDQNTDNIEVAEDAKLMVRKQREAADEDKKRRYGDANDEAARYILSNQAVPASVEARMDPNEAIKMREMQNKGMTPDPVVYNDIRNRVLTGQPLVNSQGQTVTINDLRWDLGNKFDEIAQIASDPAKLVNARTADEIIKSASGRLIGKSTPQSTKDFDKIETFRRSLQVDIDAVQKATGRPASPDDVQKIVDRKLLTVNPAGIGGDRPAFLLKPGEQFTVDGIPDDRVHIIKGRDGKQQEISYDAMISDLTAIAQRRNITVTPETLKDLYARALKSGQLLVKYDQ